ncbi:branched-chain amino acid ABC transporter permease [Rhizobiales bacterium]|uniref:branched-chain amino acid ABC transporter permease n=1 Tax=Hongsoonwoonella zoysiae TaxID=2821844 RepID=UPI0015605267|nr:branched-chain amino acid ABC transporter permease [Hongsoonwoonella zoysiae]NRG17290.1 branched-chain amino acid ABC transporter permease [Hongsoonwoonella zoysiae]
MLYREAGQFKTTYDADQAIFPIAQDRWAVIAFAAIAFLVVPFFVNDYWTNAVLLPLLIYGLAALGLNILVGYCGQISLGTGGFMAVGAFASYKLMTSFPELNIAIVVLLSGGATALVGVMFGLPSLRIKGFYLAVATLAAQFFLVWLFNKVGWFYNYSATGQISVPERSIFGLVVTGPTAAPWVKYLFCLSFLALFGLIAKNVVRGRIGRNWMAIRDMDIAAELIGVRPLQTKLSAFAFSSFYVGMAGSLLFTIYLGAIEVTEVFGINVSFLVLFMVIIGGLGSILGSFLGATFLVLMPIFLKNFMVDGLGLLPVLAKHVEILLMGLLIMGFLIVEPHGLARMWQILKEKFRLWPFPY